jgi:hypothetical protein
MCDVPLGGLVKSVLHFAHAPECVITLLVRDDIQAARIDNTLELDHRDYTSGLMKVRNPPCCRPLNVTRRKRALPGIRAWCS